MRFRYVNSLYGETRYRRMIALVEKFCEPKDKTVVDLGAGGNAISDHISCRRQITIDFNEDSNPDIVHDLSLDIPLPDNSCDIVIAGEILEHIYHSRRFLLEVKRILQKDGYLIISVPNICFLFYRVAWLLGIVPPFAAKADYTYLPAGGTGGHVRDYSFKELENILTSLNFDILKSTTNGIIYKGFYIPHFLAPKTLGQKIIMLAKNKKH